MDNVIQFAKDNGYDNAKYRGVWEGYKVYEPFYNDEGSPCIGLPYFILTNKTEMRMCEPEECFKILSTINEHRRT